MTDLRIYIHKSCPTSIRLLELLREEGIIEKFDIVDVEEKGYVSVPTLEIEDKVVDFGPIDF